MEKKYTSKDYLKIVIIAGIISIPLIFAYSITGSFESELEKFWSDWDCDRLVEFATTPEFKKITDEQHMQYNLDIAPCIEEPLSDEDLK